MTINEETINNIVDDIIKDMPTNLNEMHEVQRMNYIFKIYNEMCANFDYDGKFWAGDKEAINKQTKRCGIFATNRKRE